MDIGTEPLVEAKRELHFDLGSFEGFNFREDAAIEDNLTAQDVVNWDHDRDGEAEFWPSGDHAGTRLVFQNRTAITASELVALDALLHETGDSEETFLIIYFALHCCDEELSTLTEEKLMESDVFLFIGQSFMDLRSEAAYELFETYWPEAYKAWESCRCDGLHFDVDRFLDSPSWAVEEATYGDQKALLIRSQ